MQSRDTVLERNKSSVTQAISELREVYTKYYELEEDYDRFNVIIAALEHGPATIGTLNPKLLAMCIRYDIKKENYGGDANFTGETVKLFLVDKNNKKLTDLIFNPRAQSVAVTNGKILCSFYRTYRELRLAEQMSKSSSSSAESTSEEEESGSEEDEQEPYLGGYGYGSDDDDDDDEDDEEGYQSSNQGMLDQFINY